MIEQVGERRIANQVVIDVRDGTFTIDGHNFPYHIPEGGPTVDAPTEPGFPCVVTIPMWADNVRLTTADGVEEYHNPWVDPEPSA